MNNQEKIDLLKNRFSSEEYILGFLKEYTIFLSHGIKLYSEYSKFVAKNPSYIPSENLTWEADFWGSRVVPTLNGMKQACEEAKLQMVLGNKRNIVTLAMDLSGFSKGMDGSDWGKAFANILRSELHREFHTAYRISSQMGSNISKTLNDRWKDLSILNPQITGPVDI